MVMVIASLTHTEMLLTLNNITSILFITFILTIFMINIRLKRLIVVF